MSDTCVRWKLDYPQILISTAAVFGIGLVFFDFNMKAFYTARDIMAAAFFSENHKWVPVDDEDSNTDAEDSNTDADTPQTKN